MKEILKKLGISRRIWLLLLFPVTFLLSITVGKSPVLAEQYAEGPYSSISHAINGLTGRCPLSIAEIVVILLVLGFLVYLGFFLFFLFKKRGERLKTTAKFFTNLLCFVGVVYFLFLFTCGINYSRYSFAKAAGLDVKPSTEAELTHLCNNLAENVNRLRGQVKTDDSSVMELHSGGFSYAAEEARKSYDRMSAEYPTLKSGYSGPKPVVLSELMSRCDLTGIFFPFTFEANVNYRAPAYTIPATMCHELSHLRGYMREDEANFIGYLVCLKSDDPDFQYSGNMLAFTNASNALYAKDPKAANAVFAKLSSGVKKDLSYNSQYWANYEGPVAHMSNSVNNSYLKANSQSDGIQSYGRMVDLLLARQRAQKAKSGS